MTATWWRRALHAAGWAAVVPLAAFVAARFLAPDARVALVALNAATALVLLPAWVVAALAAVLRLRILLIVAVALVLVHVALLWPEITARQALPKAARGAPQLRIFDANVQAENHDPAAVDAEIRRAHPDVVALEEGTLAFATALDRLGAFEELPFRLQVGRSGHATFAVASRYPLLENEAHGIDGQAVVIETTLDLPGRRQRLFVVHTKAPFGPNRERWGRDLALVRREANRQRGSPLLVVGDFNATWGNRGFRRLLDDGFVDAAAARGHPFQMTWPRNWRFLPPVLRLDHVLTRGSGLTVTAIRTGHGTGSDHRPLIATVALVSKS